MPVAIGAVVASLFAVRESRDETVGREVDFAGVAVLTAGLSALILALVEGNEWGWGSPAIVALLVGSAFALALVGAIVVAMIVSFSMLGVFFFLALYMQDILRYSPLEAGVRFLPSTLMIVGLAPVAGRLADRFGPRWLSAPWLPCSAPRSGWPRFAPGRAPTSLRQRRRRKCWP